MDPATAAHQVLRMACDGKVRTTEGQERDIRADTVCLHGDGPQPVEFARRLRQELTGAGLTIKAYGS